MFAHLPLIAIAAVITAQAPAPPARLCGGADLSRGKLSMTVRILNAPADLHSPWVHVRSRNDDGSYSLTVDYRPTEQGLGKPNMVHVDALMSFAGDAEARPIRFEYREPGEAWLNPVSWMTPQRHSPDEEARFRAIFRMGQGEPLPHGTDVLDEMARGVRYEFRNLDEAGNVVSTGTADYPPQQVIEGMYSTARAQAVARLRPCPTGQPPAIVPAARPTPNP